MNKEYDEMTDEEIQAQIIKAEDEWEKLKDEKIQYPTR